MNLKKIDIQSSRVSDNGIIYFLEKTKDFEPLTHIKANDNYISERIEK